MLTSSNPKSVIRLLTYALVFTTAVNIAFLGIVIHLFYKLVPPPRAYCTPLATHFFYIPFRD